MWLAVLKLTCDLLILIVDDSAAIAPPLYVVSSVVMESTFTDSDR